MATSEDAALKLLVEFELIRADQVEEARKQLRGLKETTTEQAESTAKLGEEESKASGETEKFELNHRALHALFHILGHETVPEFGHALTASLYGPAGLALALTVAIAGVVKTIQQAHEETRKLIEAQQELDASVWTAQRDAMASVNAEIDKMTAATQKLISARNELKDMDEGEASLNKARTEGELKILEAKHKAELAALETRKEAEKAQREALHITGGEQAFEDKYKAQEKAINDKFAAQVAVNKLGQGGEGGIQEQEDALNRRLNAEKGLSDKEEAAKAAYADEASNKKLADDKTRLDKANETLSKVQPEIGTLIQTGQNIPKELQKQYDDATATIAELTPVVKAEQKARDALKAKMDEANEAHNENIKAIKDYSTKINQAIQVLQVRMDAESQSASALGEKGVVNVINSLMDRLKQQADDFKALQARVDKLQ